MIEALRLNVKRDTERTTDAGWYTNLFRSKCEEKAEEVEVVRVKRQLSTSFRKYNFIYTTEYS